MDKSILIVDDTYEKTQVISKYINSIPNCEIVTVVTAQQAIEKLSKKAYDLMIVDLQIPAKLGEEIDPTGGVDLIRYCSLHETLNQPTHIIGITSHIDSYDQALIFFDKYGWPLVFGVNDQDSIHELVQTKLRHLSRKSPQADIAIITALHKVELETVLKLPYYWEEIRFPDDSNIYFQGNMVDKNGENKRVVATCCSHMGMSAAATITMKVCAKFKPSTLIMTGIAAGIQGKTNFGDILIADPSWDWGNGKLTIDASGSVHMTAPHQISLNLSYRSIFQNISATRTHMDEIWAGWPESERPGNSLNLHVGPLATGAVVLEDPKTVSKIISQHRELVGIDMEAYGFSYAAKVAEGVKNAVVIKSVCDFADPQKNDDWQMYAAYTSTQLANIFLTEYDVFS